MLATALKAKLILMAATAGVVGTGTVATVYLTRPAAFTSSAADQVPLPTAPPTAAAPTANPAPSEPAQPPLSIDQTTPVSYPAPQAGSYYPTQTSTIYAPSYLLSESQLDQLLAPIALYPDPLIAQLLPASTYNDDLAAAARWVNYNPNPTDFALDRQPWEPSIKAMAHSPSVLIWMYNNPDWTHTLGTAFTYQPQDVISSIQRLRAQAYAAGSLYDTNEQLIVVADRNICIEPARVDLVYVPVYDWHAVYTRRPVRPVFSFFVGFHVGSWLDNDCDWDGRHITVGARWDRGWDHRWDHDRNARQTNVIIRNDNRRDDDRRDDNRPGGNRPGDNRPGDTRGDNRPGDNRPNADRTTVNNTTVNNNTTVVNNTRTVQVGGTQWQRNVSKAPPTTPASVRPAGRAPAADRPTPPTRVNPARPVITPQQPKLPLIPPTRDTGDGRGNDNRGNDNRGNDNRGNDNRGNDRTGDRGNDRPTLPVTPPAADRGNDRPNIPVTPPARDNRGTRGDRGNDRAIPPVTPALPVTPPAPTRGDARGNDRVIIPPTPPVTRTPEVPTRPAPNADGRGAGRGPARNIPATRDSNPGDSRGRGRSDN